MARPPLPLAMFPIPGNGWRTRLGTRWCLPVDSTMRWIMERVRNLLSCALLDSQSDPSGENDVSTAKYPAKRDLKGRSKAVRGEGVVVSPEPCRVFVTGDTGTGKPVVQVSSSFLSQLNFRLNHAALAVFTVQPEAHDSGVWLPVKRIVGRLLF
ncbi:hypothetical protein BDV10DRAFT_119859 [Aspergillus recurvatus]